MEAFIEQRKRASPKGRIYLRAKRVGQWPLLNRTKCSAPCYATSGRSKQKPVRRNELLLKQAWRSSDLQHSTAAQRESWPRFARLEPSG